MSTVKIALYDPPSKRPKRIEAKVIARVGCWTITPAYYAWGSFDSRSYVVTHIPTGYQCANPRGLREARRLLSAFAALPNQRQWAALKHASRITKAMKAAGKAAVASVPAKP